MNSYFSNNAAMCDPSGTILGKPEKLIKDPYSNFFVQLSLEKAVSSSKTRVFISSFLLQCFTSFVIDVKNKSNL